jgi:hypothetical protein
MIPPKASETTQQRCSADGFLNGIGHERSVDGRFLLPRSGHFLDSLSCSPTIGAPDMIAVGFGSKS